MQKHHGKFVGEYRDADRRKHRKHFDTARAATKWADSQRHKVQQGKAQAAQASARSPRRGAKPTRSTTTAR